ncbi:hypothetical protein EUGRSUZ_B01062 [Eucalyptus grandis]|uniref:Uncharacterized protein n=2 Tax=Eucalyptus grandis TaxID=71139 RepID=A0ACC3LP08_EUCGR|nr:hypothetical protein EUGRSUZ_B01062 [Eucalyptus grandis]
MMGYCSRDLMDEDAEAERWLEKTEAGFAGFIELVEIHELKTRTKKQLRLSCGCHCHLYWQNLLEGSLAKTFEVAAFHGNFQDYKSLDVLRVSLGLLCSSSTLTVEDKHPKMK